MADIYDQLEHFALQYSEKVGQAQDEVFRALINLVDGKTSEQALEILSELDIGASLQLKLTNGRTLFEGGAVLILQNTFTTQSISEKALRGLLDGIDSKLSKRFTDVVGDDMRSIIVDGISTGKFPSQILKESKEALDTLGHSGLNARKEIQTAFSQYANTITNMAAEKAPANTKFVYIGAYDVKTRPECVDKIQFGKKTREEIITRFGDLNNEIWNCRHKWEEMGSSPADQGYNPTKFEG